MKKHMLALVTIAMILISCSKKKDVVVPIDMTLKTYSVQVPYRSLSVILELNFKNDGTVILSEFPTNEYVILQYDIDNKNSESTTLRIHGELDKSFYPDGLKKGTKINWNSNIGRQPDNAFINGFTAGEYHFTSK
jgi:hypothetical protein